MNSRAELPKKTLLDYIKDKEILELLTLFDDFSDEQIEKLIAAMTVILTERGFNDIPTSQL